MLTLCHWSHDFLAEGCLLFPPHRKPLEMFTSRALCTELWRQILVMFFDFFNVFFKTNIGEITWPHLNCSRDIKNNSVVVRLWYTNKKQCFVCANCISITHSFSLPLFSHFLEKYICYGEQSHAVLKKLSEHGKKMFLITNSPFDFV